MPETSQEVYHCPSCGALASVEDGAARVCSECGFDFGNPVRISPRSVSQHARQRESFVQRDVSLRRSAAGRVEPVLPADIHGMEDVQPESKDGNQDEIVSDDGVKKVVRRRKKRRKNRLAPLLFLGGWAIVVMLLVIFVKNQRGEEEPTVDVREEEAVKLAAKKLQMDKFLNAEIGKCEQTLHAFLAAHPDEKGRSQFVRDFFGRAPIMRDYYRHYPRWTLPSSGKLVRKSINLYTEAGEPVIETVYGVEGGEEPVADREVAFIRKKKGFTGDAGRWVIDWEALVRHSTTRWLDFVKDFGETKDGEFRVYVRRTQGGSHGDLVLKFFPPQMGSREIWDRGSDPIVVPSDEESGLSALEILKRKENLQRMEEILSRNKQWKLGNSTFGLGDPEELHRVRVKLQWEEDDINRRSVKLREVVAGNWYGKGFEDEFPDQEEDHAEEDKEEELGNLGAEATTPDS